MKNLFLLFQPSIRKWWCLLLLGLVCAVQTKAVSLNIGQYTTFSVSAPQGWITSASWSSSASELQLEPNGEVCNAYFWNYRQGTVTVTCTFWYSYQTYYNGRTHIMTGSGSRSFTVSCNRPSFTIDKTAVTLQPGETVILSTKTSPTSSVQWPRVFWQSSDVLAVQVVYDEVYDNSYSQKIRYKAASPGVSTITASIGGGITATCVITVANIEPDKVTLPSTKSVTVGETVTLTPTISPSNASTTFTWSSDNTNIATVSSNGVVTGKKVGTTNITVKTANGKSASCNVTVEKANVSVSIDTESGLYANGKRVSITASKADAKIYYTINGSMPTSSSLLYTAPITLNESLTLKAVAMGDNYNSSNILTRIYEVTSLAVVASESKNSLNSPYYVPFVTFNENIKAGSRFQDVKLLNSDNVAISGEVLTQEKAIYFSPTELLPSDTYTLEIPEKAITSESGQPNLMAQFLFTVGKYQTVSKVATGSEQSYVLKSDGTLWAAGRNTHGILGNGTKNDMHTHVKILDNVKDVSVGQWHVMALRADGSVWAWGWNYYHQLGKYEGEECLYPIKIFDDMDKIIAGREGSYAIKKDGTLWVIGSYADSNSGIWRSSKTPTKIMDNVKIFADASDNHYLLIKEDDTLWASGYNGQGQIGDGTHNNRLTPVKIMDDVLSASAGNYCSFAIKKDGSLWAWGANDYGQLGASIDEEDKDVPVKIMDDVKMVSGGSWHNVAVKNDNTLWAWGWNRYGILGDGTSVDRNSPVKILENVSNASAGYKYSLAVKTDGTLWACGTNDYGQWGNGTTTGNNVPELVLGLKAIENVTFKETNINVQLNEKYVLLFNLSPADANISKVEFKSDNESVVSVSNHGVIQAKKVGTATITVTVDDTFTATCKVNVAETLGVGSINFEGEADDVYYDLQGRRVSKPTAKGVYIKNGKKVTIK